MKIPELETERLILRRHEEKDFADMREYLSDEKVVAFEPYLPMSDDEVRECLRERMESDEFIAVEEKASGKMIGNPIWKDSFLYAKRKDADALPEQIQKLEVQMWEAARARDKKAFLELVSGSAVMVCGGFRCTGAEYAEIIAQFDCKEYEIQNFEVTASAPGLVQVHYTITLTVSDPANADLAGTFHITTTWQQNGEGYQVIFNMDQRVFGNS